MTNSNTPPSEGPLNLLHSTAEDIRLQRERAEGLTPSTLHVYRGPFHEQRAQVRQSVSGAAVRARETWIGTRWYARSHPRVTVVLAIAVGLVAVAAVAVALRRSDD